MLYVLLFALFCEYVSLLILILIMVHIGSSVSIPTDYGLGGPGIESRWGEIFRRPDRPWGPPSLLYNGYWVFPGGKVWQGHAAYHPPPSSGVVMEG